MDLKKILCEPFCFYFKPGKNDELTCKGYSIIEKLLQNGKDITFQKSDKVITKATEEVLVKHMCCACPFYEDDCDFIGHGKNSPPCGGFTLLVLLLQSDCIDIADIIKNIR